MGKGKLKYTTLSMICAKHGYKIGSFCAECMNELAKGPGGPYVRVFKPMVYEDICETPLLISSRKELKETCKKYDVTAARLL